jgi:hypothetical protein
MRLFRQLQLGEMRQRRGFVGRPQLAHPLQAHAEQQTGLIFQNKTEHRLRQECEFSHTAASARSKQLIAHAHVLSVCSRAQQRRRKAQKRHYVELRQGALQGKHSCTQTSFIK